MKTDELINLMVADSRVRMRLGRALAMALVAGIAISILLLLATVGLRRDIATALYDQRVIFKIGMTLLLSVAAGGLLFAIGRPGMPLRTRLAAIAVPLVLLVAAVIAELSVVPPGDWKMRMIGNNARFCLIFIPLLALGPLAAFIAALRHGAPDNPGIAGAAAGLAAGAIASATYAWHCADDSPLFVATWYTVAIAVVTSLGYLAGRRMLKW